jgi:hypothetical protein
MSKIEFICLLVGAIALLGEIGDPFRADRTG